MKKPENFLEENSRSRQTKTRRMFIEILTEKHIPLSASQILAALARKGVSVNKTTVYRELERLENLGIIHDVRLNNRKRFYELALRDHHHHLICMECENVEDIDFNEEELAQQEKRMSTERNFMVLRHSLEFFGLCKKCRFAL